jgi:hypothetical protein
MLKNLKVRIAVSALLLFIAACGQTDEISTTPTITPGGNQPTTNPIGSTWTQQTSPTANILYAVAWQWSGSGPRFVAVGETGTIIWSSDGINWNLAIVVPTVKTLKDVTWTGTQFVAVGGEATLETTVLTSPDGDVWTAVPQLSLPYNGAAAIQLGGVSSDGGSTIAAVAVAGQIIRSIDGGASWTAPVSGVAEELIAITWSDAYFKDVSGTLTYVPGKFVAAGSNGAIITSVDGVAWVTSQTPAVNLDWWAGVAWSGSSYVAVGGTGGAVATSPEAAPGSWTTSSTILTATNPEGVDWSNDQFLVVGYTSLGGGSYDSRVGVSPDGSQWSIGTVTGLGVQLLDVVGVTGLYVAVGAGGTIITSQ